jgi:protein-L-isoaspartate(D-aspartate) O-methyltransferase
MTDFDEQRLNMVESQVRPSDVTDQRIVMAMLEVPRERFVPAELASLAYIDDPVPATARSAQGEPRSLLPPRTFAKLVQLAEVGPQSKVLDVGCATGYSTAVLARLAARVVALEADPELVRATSERMEEIVPGNVKVIAGPLAGGVPAEAGFDAIILGGSVSAVPQALLDQLADGGRLVAMLHRGPVCRAQVWRRSGKVIDGHAAFDGAAATLPGFEVPAAFVL